MIWRVVVSGLAVWWGWNGIQVLSCGSVSFTSRTLHCYAAAPGASWYEGSMAEGFVYHPSGNFSGLVAGLGILIAAVVVLIVVWWGPVTRILASRTPPDV